MQQDEIPEYKIIELLADGLSITDITNRYPKISDSEIKNKLKTIAQRLQKEYTNNLTRVSGYVAYVDGTSRGNPGDAGIGVVLQDETGKIVEELSRYIGQTTNNVAEYHALLSCMRLAKKYKVSQLKVYSDNELLVKQLQKKYRIKDTKLIPLFNKIVEQMKLFDKLEIMHINRAENKLADRLANFAIDNHRASVR